MPGAQTVHYKRTDERTCAICHRECEEFRKLRMNPSCLIHSSMVADTFSVGAWLQPSPAFGDSIEVSATFGGKNKSAA